MSFIAANPRGQDVPRVMERDVAAGEAWEYGSAILMDANGAWAECGANPALIAGFAISAYKADTGGFNILGRQGFPPGRAQIVLARDMEFHCEFVGALPAADGGNYDIILGGDGIWRINFASVAAARLKLLGRLTRDPNVDPTRVRVQVLPANIQII